MTREIDDYEYIYNDYTYSELFSDYDGEKVGQKDWLDYLSHGILEAYNEYTTDKDDKEDY